MDRRIENRANAAGYLATGGALYGAGAAANYALDRRLENKGVKPPLKSLVQDKRLRAAHVPHLAGKTGVRALQVTGLPLAAAGAYGMLRPKKNQRPLDVKQDVIKPVVHAATYKDAADKVHKSVVEMSAAEHQRQAQRKARARRISLASGTLGATALALRAPEAAGVLARRVPKVAKPLNRIAGKEQAATKLSNTLGVGAIGVGSAGSFNYARIAGTEAKAEKQQVRKRDDRFIRQYRSRISPEAERGYQYLKTGRNKAAGISGLATGLGASTATATAMDIARRRYGRAALGAGLTAVNAGTAVQQGRKAVRWEGHMKKIRAKAYEREAQGVYGRGRPADIAKGLMLKNPGFGLPYPKGTLRKPALRVGGVRRISGGRMASFRGSYG